MLLVHTEPQELKRLQELQGLELGFCGLCAPVCFYWTPHVINVPQILLYNTIIFPHNLNKFFNFIKFSVENKLINFEWWYLVHYQAKQRSCEPSCCESPNGIPGFEINFFNNLPRKISTFLKQRSTVHFDVNFGKNV